MDFIERILNVSPDGGSGLVEWAIVLVLLTILLAVVTLSGSANESGFRLVALVGVRRSACGAPSGASCRDKHGKAEEDNQH